MCECGVLWIIIIIIILIIAVISTVPYFNNKGVHTALSKLNDNIDKLKK